MIRFLDLKAINDSFEPGLSEAIRRVLDSGRYLLGNEITKFEQEYAGYIGTKHCIGVANGLDALRLIFKAYIELGEMHEGDEIIVPSNTYIASILAISENRLHPVLVEPDIATYNIDPYKIEYKISERTRGIMIVHLYGQNAMHQEIRRLTFKYKLKLIEDNAQAAGTSFGDKRTGALGHASGNSFYPSKNIGALGDAGSVTTNHDELAEVIRAMSNYGSSKKYINDYQGLNSRLDEIQAAVLRTKLSRLDSDNQRRREIAQYYTDHIDHPSIVLPSVISDNAPMHAKEHVWHLFVIRHPRRYELQRYLTDHGIQTMIHYPVPPHKQKAYKEWNDQHYPICEQIHNEVLSLPISQVMRDEEVLNIVDIINKF